MLKLHRNKENNYSHILTSNRFHAIIMVAKGVLVVFLKKIRETAVSQKKLQNFNNFFFVKHFLSALRADNRFM